MTQICLISDTHNKLDWIKDIPEADVLVHCGDALGSGSFNEFIKFVKDIKALAVNYREVLFTPGNHDRIIENDPATCRFMLQDVGVTMLIDEAVTVDDVVFYGSPYTPTFFNWSFMADRGEYIARVWNRIPDDVDVLFTHGPAYGHLDKINYVVEGEDPHVGCEELLKVVERVKPVVYASGHIHSARSKQNWFWGDGSNTLFINCSVCNEKYEPVNSPFLVDLDLNKSPSAQCLSS